MTSRFAEYRKTLSCIPTGVAIVTAAASDGQYAGVTANSFCSVSLDPPLILWTTSIWEDSYRVFRAAPRFAVNILSVEQRELSGRFSASEVGPFSGLPFDLGIDGVPLLATCAATLECIKHDAHRVAEHAIIVGQVQRFFRDVGRTPLVSYREAYGCQQPGPPMPASVRPELAASVST